MEKLIMARARAFGFAIFLAMTFAANAADVPAKPPLREINITSDSAPGWIPTVDQSNAAERTARVYLAAEDAGKTQEAYGYLADLNKAHLPFEEYKANVESLNAQIGAVIERRIVKVTWTKDSPNAPAPGIYAAVDLASRFAGADRHCGFLILYQPNGGNEFQVMREESNVLDNDAAADIARKGSPADVVSLWTKISANCPNYPGFTAKP